MLSRRHVIRNVSFFGKRKLLSTTNVLTDMFSGIGEADITPTSINISSYPFEPSSAFPSKNIPPAEISEINLSGSPPTLMLNQRSEIIFVSALQSEALQNFAEKNNISVRPREHNWELITVPYLDREVDSHEEEFTVEVLRKQGITPHETVTLRRQVGEAMTQYNTTTGLCDDWSLGLADVLQAMRAVLSQEEYMSFYWQAMEVEVRGSGGKSE